MTDSKTPKPSDVKPVPVPTDDVPTDDVPKTDEAETTETEAVEVEPDGGWIIDLDGNRVPRADYVG